MRFWLPLDETPAWFGSRPVQLFLLACVALVVAGIAAAFVVRVDSASARVLALAIMLPGLPLLGAFLLRSQRVRRHHAGAEGDRTAGPRP